jgi:hypothetical protein
LPFVLQAKQRLGFKRWAPDCIARVSRWPAWQDVAKVLLNVSNTWPSALRRQPFEAVIGCPLQGSQRYHQSQSRLRPSSVTFAGLSKSAVYRPRGRKTQLQLPLRQQVLCHARSDRRDLFQFLAWTAVEEEAVARSLQGAYQGRSWTAPSADEAVRSHQGHSLVVRREDSDLEDDMRAIYR